MTKKITVIIIVTVFMVALIEACSSTRNVSLIANQQNTEEIANRVESTLIAEETQNAAATQAENASVQLLPQDPYQNFVYASGHNEITVVGANGEIQQIIKDLPRVRYPSWSPNKTMIAFVSISFEGDDTIYIVNLANQNVTPVYTSESLAKASWSPDSKYLLFEVKKQTWQTEILIYDVQGDCSKTIYNSGELLSEPIWSPEGGKFAFIENETLNIFYLSTRTIQHLTNPPEYSLFGGLDWSPNGKFIAFHADITGDVEIHYIDAETKELFQLTNAYDFDTYPQWSPDGSTIFYSSMRDDGKWKSFQTRIDNFDTIEFNNEWFEADWLASSFPNDYFVPDIQCDR